MRASRVCGIALAVAWLHVASSGRVQAQEDPPPEAPAEPAAPPPGAAQPAEANLSLSSAELAQLDLAQDSAGDVQVDTAFRLYGFADFTYRLPLGQVNELLYSKNSSFYVGSFNLYLSKNIADQLRMFAELRFLFLPNGTLVRDSISTLVDTTVDDYNELNRSIRWGSLQIQRVYMEYELHALLTLRLGVFLTPYGIWNVDHGSPTIVTVQRPFTLGFQLFPETQTGIEAFGLAQLDGHNSVGYHLTLSNGLGPATEYKDLDSNKAVGGRVYYRNDNLGELRIGGSIFYGRDTAAQQLVSLNAERKLIGTTSITSQSDVLGLAADLQWLYRGVLVQSELIAQQRKYTERGRMGSVNIFKGEYLAPADALSMGFYALVGYRFDWLGVMPYFLWQRFDGVEQRSLSRIRADEIMAGLNVRPLDAWVFKLEYRYVWFPQGFLFAQRTLEFVQAQVAWAF